MKNVVLFFLSAFLCFSGMANAVQPNEMLADPVLEARARHIGAELRCLVCQNQSIDDSDADLAHDLRVLVRQRVQAGDSDEQVRQYLVNRYGDYILLNPPFKFSTYALWLLPPFFVMAGIGMAWMYSRQRNGEVDKVMASLSREEQARLKLLLDDNNEKLKS